VTARGYLAWIGHSARARGDVRVRRRTRPVTVLAALLLGVLPVSAWSSDTDQDIVVHVQMNGQIVAVDVDCPVDAPGSVVWEVLTDYDHMAQFISNLEYSGVDDRLDDLLRVHQKGKASRGILTMRFDNVREIHLVPHHEIRSRLISGDLKASDFVTRIVEVGAQVHIVNSGRYTPKVWVPPLIGPALIEAEIKKQFGEFRTEILRRNATVRSDVTVQ
jgi:Polyketide cyclase / dehydrase and lipid transport